VDAALALPAPSSAVQGAEASGRLAGLVARYAHALDAGQETSLREALALAPSPGAWRDMAVALDRAMEPEAEAVAARLFAIPVAVVAGGKSGARVSAALPEVERLGEVLRENRALGPVTNFGLGNALRTHEELTALSWARVRRFAQGRGDAAADADWFGAPPADLVLADDEESVHLRYLVGAAVAPAHAPSFVETGSAIGTWGMPFTRELSAQLQTEGVSLVAIPRPPAALLAASVSGFQAAEDLALQAFVSRELRRFRSEIGEPEVSLAALTTGVLGLRFASSFVENRVFVHERRLHPAEEWDQVLRDVLELLEQCRIETLHLEAQAMEPAAFAAGLFSRH